MVFQIAMPSSHAHKLFSPTMSLRLKKYRLMTKLSYVLMKELGGADHDG